MLVKPTAKIPELPSLAHLSKGFLLFNSASATASTKKTRTSKITASAANLPVPALKPSSSV